jgi:glyoxylase-like metal-dependent hydrolase (beta-lactamase superfamily II)
VNTHSHFDHVDGNARFLPVQIWGHVSLPPIVATPPDQLVEHAASVDLGDRGVVLRHLGRGHTGGDLVVSVPDTGVTFAGDLVEESGPPAYGDDCFPLEWPVTNARLLGLLRDGDRVVPGHGTVVDRRFVADQQRALNVVAKTILHLWVGEVPLDAALAAGAASWPFPAGILADAVARGYAEMEVNAERGERDTGG